MSENNVVALPDYVGKIMNRTLTWLGTATPEELDLFDEQYETFEIAKVPANDSVLVQAFNTRRFLVGPARGKYLKTMKRRQLDSVVDTLNHLVGVPPMTDLGGEPPAAASLVDVAHPDEIPDELKDGQSVTESSSSDSGWNKLFEAVPSPPLFIVFEDSTSIAFWNVDHIVNDNETLTFDEGDHTYKFTVFNIRYYRYANTVQHETI